MFILSVVRVSCRVIIKWICRQLIWFMYCFRMSMTSEIQGSAVAWWLMSRALDPEAGVRAPLGSNRVVSLSKAHLPPKSTGNTQEAVAPSLHD